MKNCPCQGCTKREIGCHNDNCKPWVEYQERHAKEKAAEKRWRSDSYVESCQLESIAYGHISKGWRQ